MSRDVQLSPATSNAPIVTLPSLAPAGHVTEAPACHSRGPGPVRRRPGARPGTGTDHKRQAPRGTCQASPATLLTAIDPPGTSDTPGTDVTQTCAATRRQVSTATTPAHPILLVMELMARLQVGHLPNPIFEPQRIWHRSNRTIGLPRGTLPGTAGTGLRRTAGAACGRWGELASWPARAQARIAGRCGPRRADPTTAGAGRSAVPRQAAQAGPPLGCAVRSGHRL